MNEAIEMFNDYDSGKYIDLHTHSVFSDGELTPMELVDMAIKRNVSVLAITDHNTFQGVKMVDRNDKLIVDSGIRVINGIELSAKVPKGQMHILGYGFDLEESRLNARMGELRENSINSFLAIVEQIRKDYGIIFESDDIERLLCSNRNLGRPDVARLCIKYGYVDTVAEAFRKYLIEAHNKTRGKRKKLTYEECIQLILGSGGVPVLAHPKSLLLDEKEFLILLRDMISKGLMGIEAIHSTHTNWDIEYYKRVADDFGLVISGGSDFHGERTKPDIMLGSGINGNVRIKRLSVLDRIR